jgi:hypothetical protein
MILKCLRPKSKYYLEADYEIKNRGTFLFSYFDNTFSAL